MNKDIYATLAKTAPGYIRSKADQWLNRYGRTYRDDDGWYNDCDMVDGCMHDLGLDEAHRSTIRTAVDEYIQVRAN